MNQRQLARRVGRYIKKSRLNQQDIAKLLDIPRSALSAVIAGTRGVTAWELLKLCQLFDVTPNEMVGWDEPVVDDEPNE